MNADGSISACNVCGKDRDFCQHTTDEHYDALLAEATRHNVVQHQAYKEIMEWAMKTRRERNAMKRQIRELLQRNAKLQRRVFELTGGAEAMTV